MKVTEIINEIKFMPNYLYRYGGELYGKYVILGGLTSEIDSTDNAIELAKGAFETMLKTYQKRILNIDDEIVLARRVIFVHDMCYCKSPELSTIEEQEKYLRNLNEEDIDDIYEQVNMYKSAKEYHKKHMNNRN